MIKRRNITRICFYTSLFMAKTNAEEGILDTKNNNWDLKKEKGVDAVKDEIMKMGNLKA